MNRKTTLKTMLLPVLATCVLASGALPVAAEAAQHHRGQNRNQTTVIEKTRVVKAVTIREHTVVRRTAARPSRPTRVHDRPARQRTRTVVVRQPVIIRQPVIVKKVAYVQAPPPPVRTRVVYRDRVVDQPVYRQPAYYNPPVYSRSFDEQPHDYSGYVRSRAVNHYHRDAAAMAEPASFSLISWLSTMW